MAKGSRPKTIASIDTTWERIESWLTLNWTADAELPAGVGERALKKAEADMGLRLPADLRESYFRHDGSGRFNLFPFGSWHYSYPLLPVAGMLAHWSQIQTGVEQGYFSGPDFVSRPKGPIKKVWFHAQWVPIVDDQCGDYVFADLAPEKGGRVGQIIEFHRDTGATEVLAQSFSELLSSVADDLEAGKYAYDKKTDSLVLVSSGRGR
jgi:cell wall assembly regulator SMI1